MTFEELKDWICQNKKRVEWIRGWGLSVSPTLKKLGTLEREEKFEGCTTSNCTHASHSPGAHWYRWIPREGELYEIYDEACYDREASWSAKLFVLFLPQIPDGLVLIYASYPQWHHDHAECLRSIHRFGKLRNVPYKLPQEIVDAIDPYVRIPNQEVLSHAES